MKKPRLSNIPTWEIRDEFEFVSQVVRSPRFAEYLDKAPTEPIRMGTYDWNWMPDQLLTFIVQRAILGAESYVVSAVRQVLWANGKMTKALEKAVQNPFNFDLPKGQRGGTALRVYHYLPMQVHEDISLQLQRPGSWKLVVDLYEHVRNRIFHGQQFEHATPKQVEEYLWILKQIFDWVDSWCPDTRGSFPRYIKFVTRPKT